MLTLAEPVRSASSKVPHRRARWGKEVVRSDAVDSRVVAGLRAQLTRRAEVLATGAEPVGWKVGFNMPAVQRAFGIDEPISGFLTSATVVPAGERHSLAGAGQPMAEPELAIHIGTDLEPGCTRAEAAAAIVALGPAIEVADLDPSLTDLGEIVAANVFHRAVLFGRPVEGTGIEDIVARVAFNGEAFGEANPLDAVLDPAGVVQHIARTIGSGGERLRSGDAIIAGTLVPPPVVSPGDELALDLGPLGSLSLGFED
jgi:2-keto-4-pentenoate hydratase